MQAASRRARGREIALLGLVFLFALGLRGVHCWGQWQTNPLFLAPNMDEGKHHEWAQRIASGDGLGPQPFFRAPLSYLALAALYRVAGPDIPLARFLGCVLGATTCLLIALLGRMLAGTRAGLIAGLVAAVYWPFIHFDQLLLTVGLETFLGVLLLLLLLAAARRGARWLYLAAGGIWGLAAITRPTALTLAPVIALWAWFGERLARPDPAGVASRPTPWRNLALIGVAAGAMIAPVTLHNRLVGGEWVLVSTNGGLNFYIGNNAQADGRSAVAPGTRTDWDGGFEDTHAIARRELAPRLGRPPTEGEISNYWYRQGWEWIRSDPTGAFGLALRKLALFWAPVEIPNNNAVWFFARQSPLARFYRIGFPVVAVLGTAGLTLLPKTAWRLWCLPVSYGLTGIFTVVAFFVVERYRMPLVPVLMLAAGAGLARLPELWSQRRLPRLAAFAMVAVVMTGVELAARPGGAFWPSGDRFPVEEEARGEHALGGYYLRAAREQPDLWGEALRHYRAAATVMPLWPEIQLMVGVTMMRSGKPELFAQAGTALQSAVALRPAYAEAHRFYAEWLLRQDRRPEAIWQFRAVAELQPWGADYQHALLGLGVLLGQEGRYAEAGEWLVRAVQNDPRDPVALRDLAGAARWFRENGRAGDAIDLLNRGLIPAPDAAELLTELQDAYEQAGEHAKAAKVGRRRTAATSPP